jgi:hypothetical protein
MTKKELEMARILCKWNRKELTAEEALIQIWKLYVKEALEVWNNPLEKLLV